MNSSTSSSNLAPVIAFEPGPFDFEQAPFGESESALAEVIELHFAGPSQSAA